MNRVIFLLFIVFFICPFTGRAQQVVYSDYDKDDGRDMNFEIIGKMNGNIIVYKNIRWKHHICIYDDKMQTKETVNLDLPEKTMNVDFVTYANSFQMIYQYQKRNIVHCMTMRMDGTGKILSEPVEIDTTKISYFDDNKIYSTVFSEDKKKIMVFKIQKKFDRIMIASMLFNDTMGMIRRSRQTLEFDERRDTYREFMVDNDGNFVFTREKTPVNRDYSNALQLCIKPPTQDTFNFYNVDLGKFYVNDMKLKIDNLNKKYLLNSFYYKKNRGSAEGLFSYSWDKANMRSDRSNFTEFTDSLRSEARKDGSLKIAFDDYFIRQVIVKKDGGYLLFAEDYSVQGRTSNNTNPWNRWDYYNSPYSWSSSNYYYYNPYYGYYRPFSNINQGVRYFYENVCVISIDKNGKWEWNNIIHKSQYDDDNDNFLSYALVNSGDALHVLYNSDGKNQIIADIKVSPNGETVREPTLKSYERGYQFMTQHGKQVGARQLIIPCMYRGYICFAKVEF